MHGKDSQAQAIVRQREREEEIRKKSHEEKQKNTSMFVNVFIYKKGECIKDYFNEVKDSNKLLKSIKENFGEFLLVDEITELKKGDFIMVDDTPVKLKKNDMAGFITELYFDIEVQNEILEFIEKNK